MNKDTTKTKSSKVKDNTKLSKSRKKKETKKDEDKLSLNNVVNNFLSKYLKENCSRFSSTISTNCTKSKNNFSDEIIYFSKGTEEMPTSIDVGDLEEDSYITTDLSNPNNARKKILDLYDISANKDENKFLISSDFESKHSVSVKQSLRTLKKQKKAKSAETAGEEWYNMKPPEVDDEVNRDFDILQMRSILDPKRFYKSNDRESLPKYFQIGKVMDNAADFYSSRIPKKQRKSNLADELLADAKFQKYRRKKMVELIAKRQAVGGKIVKKKRKMKS